MRNEQTTLPDPMISHDAFWVIVALVESGGKLTLEQLKKRVNKSVERKLIMSLLEELHIYSYIRQYTAGYIQLNNAAEYIAAYTSLETNNNIATYGSVRAVNDLLDRTRKMANSNYRAVVAGHRPKRSPAQMFAERCISRADLAEYWRMVGEMSESERRLFDAKVTPMAFGSRRN
tara:strand:- start:35 stop:559 length:525 start_codon:yes stop_codon:yes gene_type:complete